jgi:hypothetical protein
MLDWVLAYERGHFECLTPSPRADAVLRDAYVVALRFADEAESSAPHDVDLQPVPVPFQAMCQTTPKVTASNSTFCQ